MTVGCRRERRVGLPRALHLLDRCPRSSPECVVLEKPDQRVDLIRQAGIWGCHPRPPPWRGLYQPVVLEQTQRLSHGHGADAEALREPRGRQASSGRQLTREYRVPQPLVDLLAQRRSLQELGLDDGGDVSGAGHGGWRLGTRQTPIYDLSDMNDTDCTDGLQPFIPTVNGPVDPRTLGATLTHEHIYVDWPWAIGAEPEPHESAAMLALIVERLDRAALAGVSALVDVGATAGPSPTLLLAIAARTRVTLLASTGCFAPDMTPLPTWAYPPADSESIAERFIAEARDGIRGSGVLPAVIKVASGARAISELEETVFRAAAIAQRETGLAITTHTTRTAQASNQIDLLEAAGADLGRTVIGHIGWGTGPADRPLHLALAERGVFLGLDMVGLPAATLDEWARMVLDLIEAGHEQRLLLSHDNCAANRGLLQVYGEEWLTGDFTVVHRELLPRLRSFGVSEDVLTAILVDNPRRLLTIDPKRYPRAAGALSLGGRGA